MDAPRQVWRRRQFTVVLPLGVAFVLVVIFFVHARAVEQARMQLDFERWAHTLADTLRQSFDGYLDALHAIESFYASAPEVSRPAFHLCPAVIRPLSRHSGTVVGPPCAGHGAQRLRGGYATGRVSCVPDH